MGVNEFRNPKGGGVIDVALDSGNGSENGIWMVSLNKLTPLVEFVGCSRRSTQLLLKLEVSGMLFQDRKSVV